MQQQDRLMWGTAMTVRVASIANRLFLAAVTIGLAVSWLIPGSFGALTGEGGKLDDGAIPGLRILMLIGIVMAIAAERLLVPLGAIVASAGEGDPFAPVNARRLRTIGWALLVLQLLDIPCALLARYWPGLGTAAPSGDISVGGWVATLMVFVLARVFAAGSAMREEIAGTV